MNRVLLIVGMLVSAAAAARADLAITVDEHSMTTSGGCFAINAQIVAPMAALDISGYAFDVLIDDFATGLTPPALTVTSSDSALVSFAFPTPFPPTTLDEGDTYSWAFSGSATVPVSSSLQLLEVCFSSTNPVVDQFFNVTIRDTFATEITTSSGDSFSKDNIQGLGSPFAVAVPETSSFACLGLTLLMVLGVRWVRAKRQNTH